VVVDFGLLAGRVAGGICVGSRDVGFDLGLPGFFVGLGAGLLVVALVAAWRLNRVSRSEIMIKQLSEY